MKYIFIQFIRGYRALLSPLFAQTCRFSPTCSTYMIEAIESYGVIKGVSMGLARIMKCHPYYKGDYIDPVIKPHKQNVSKAVDKE